MSDSQNDEMTVYSGNTRDVNQSLVNGSNVLRSHFGSC